MGLGANLPSPLGTTPAETLRWAAQQLQASLSDLRLSTVRVTQPVGPQDQPDYANAVAVGWAPADVDAEALLRALQHIERQAGRDRAQERRWGPRCLDLDLLLVGGRTARSATLELPHPRLAERRFVLEPLAELLADWVHPTLGQSVSSLLARLED